MSKKKIVRQSYESSSENKREREDAICPACGYDKERDRSLQNLPFTQPIQRENRAIVYTCRKCGCQWEVKR